MWTIDLKDKGTIYAGPVSAPAKAGVTLIMSDDTFEQLASGKVCFGVGLGSVLGSSLFKQMDGQKAFMAGKLKSKGNIMLATKLSGVLGVSRIQSRVLFDVDTGIDCQNKGQALEFRVFKRTYIYPS